MIQICVRPVDAVLMLSFICHIFITEQTQVLDKEVADDVRHMVACLYSTVNSEHFHTVKQRHLLATLEDIRLQLEPMEKVFPIIIFLLSGYHYCLAVYYIGQWAD